MSRPSLEWVVPVIVCSTPKTRTRPGTGYIEDLQRLVSVPTSKSYAPEPARSLFRAPCEPPGRRAKTGEAVCASARPRRGGPTHARSLVPPADRRDRPPRATETARRGGGYGRH